MLLTFNTNGMLPPGDYAMTIEELRSSILVIRSYDCDDSSWDYDWRLHLVEQLDVLCGNLWDVGITDIFVDGSFATTKSHPGDVDGYFLCEFDLFLSQQLPRLIAIDEAWDLNRRIPDMHGKFKPLMWHRYHVELYPQFHPPFECLTTAALGSSGTPVLFPEFFRHTRSGEARGIIRIIKE
ncbi:MAG: hypothetical protein JW841_00560 [Deltaproteobacteria bacterium]|nr:hypothetical protein [Deltaproteobacteria bacterium]